VENGGYTVLELACIVTEAVRHASAQMQRVRWRSSEVAHIVHKLVGERRLSCAVCGAVPRRAAASATTSKAAGKQKIGIPTSLG